MFLGVLEPRGGGSRRRGTQGSPRGPLVPPPAGHSWPLACRRLVGSGLSARAAIGSGPGWAGRGAPAYKGARRDHLGLRRRLLRCPPLSSASSRPSEAGPERGLASHGDEGRVRAEGPGPGGGHHPLRAEGKGWGGGRRPAARPCPRTCAPERRPAGPRAALVTPPPRRVCGFAPPEASAPRRCGGRMLSHRAGPAGAAVRGEAWARVQGRSSGRPWGGCSERGPGKEGGGRLARGPGPPPWRL